MFGSKRLLQAQPDRSSENSSEGRPVKERHVSERHFIVIVLLLLFLLLFFGPKVFLLAMILVVLGAFLSGVFHWHEHRN